MLRLLVLVPLITFAQALAGEAGTPTGLGLQSDCGFNGIDATFSAPVPEGKAMLSRIESQETYDEEPYPLSTLTIYSCTPVAYFSVTWDVAKRADQVLVALRRTGGNFSDWSKAIRTIAANDGVSDRLYGAIGGWIDNGQGHCACKLHYEIEVPK